MNHPLFAITMSSIASAMFAYLAFRLFFKQQINTNTTGVLILENKFLFAVLYGFFTIYAGLVTTPNGASVRLLGPMFVGMMAGRRFGVLTSLFGVALLGAKEWLHYIPNTHLLGNTFVSSVIVTLLAGYLAGFWHPRLKGKLPKIWQAVAFCVAFELLVVLPVTLAAARDFELVWRSARKTMLELILANAVGMAIMVFVNRNLIREKLALIEQQRIAGELLSARVVQQGLIQRKNPEPFTIPNIDLFAGVVNEGKVSSPFFDYYYCEQARKLYFVMGQISETTTTATLCMLVMKTLFRNKAKRAAPLRSIVADIHRELATVKDVPTKRRSFLGVLDVDTGAIGDLMAAHYPVMIRGNNGAWRHLPETTTEGCVLQEDDTLVLAHQFQNQAEAENWEKTLSPFFTPPPAMRQAGEALFAFLRDRPEAPGDEGDALMLIRFQPPAQPMTLRVDVQEINRLHAWLTDFAERRKLPEKLLAALKLVLEELVVNIIRHGFPQGPGADERIGVRLQCIAERLLIQVKDQGQAFDPFSAVAEKPRPKGAVGGWGIKLVKKYVDKMAYEHRAGANILSLEINLYGR